MAADVYQAAADKCDIGSGEKLRQVTDGVQEQYCRREIILSGNAGFPLKAEAAFGQQTLDGREPFRMARRQHQRERRKALPNGFEGCQNDLLLAGVRASGNEDELWRIAPYWRDCAGGAAPGRRKLQTPGNCNLALVGPE